MLFWLLILTLFLYSGTINTVSASYVVNLTIEEDTYVEEKFPNIAPWNNRNLYLGTDSWYGKGKTRILIKPNFATLQTQQILPNDIEKVELLITSYAYEGAKSEIVVDSYTTTSSWTMFTATWNNQPTISSSKKDTSYISTSNSRKSILVSNAFVDAYKSYPTQERGILLKVNAETEKAIIFWAHACDLAPEPPQCAGAHERPVLKLTIKANTPPSTCSLKSPATNLITKNLSNNFEANVSIDPEGDALTYYVRICTDVTCDSVLHQQQIYASSKTMIDLPDSKYYVSCLTHDGHSANDQWSIPTYLTIDSQPPLPPILLLEPPFTGTKSNTVSWLNLDAEAIQFQILSSERQDFKSYNTYFPWISETSYLIEHTKEKTFYYKVRSRDAAGNESEWSNQTWTTIDSTFPTIKYFKTNKTLLSPQKKGDGTLINTAYIQGGVDDANIEMITLRVMNYKQEIVFTQSVDQKSYLWTHWPDKLTYPDGEYYAQLRAIDFTGNEIVSDPIFLELDTTPPQKPKFLGLSDKQLIAKQKFWYEVRCQKTDVATVYVSGKIVANSKSLHIVSIDKKDGTYTTKAKCTDSAGNKSEQSISFTIDTTPPSKPSISYLFDDKKKTLQLQIYCREEGIAQFYKNGFASGEIPCKKKAYASFIPEKNIVLPYLASFTARLKDKAGNWSDLAEKTIYLKTATPVSAIKPKVSCSIVYHKTYNKFLQEACLLTEGIILTYQDTNAVSGGYSSLIHITLPIKTNVSATIIQCAGKSLWDPRTWFSCVEELVETQKLIGTGIPVITPIDAKITGFKNTGSTSLMVNHKKEDFFRLSTRFLVQYSFLTGGQTVSGSTFSNKVEVTITPRYPNGNSKKYFSWLFSGPRQVSQWYGNTAYQKPHAGIDFSVANEKILAPADGTVVSAKYHKASACFAGGNYLAIKHPNGLFTYYFHLKNLKKQNGKDSYKPGEQVKRSTFLATSGNSGMYNCEPLAAHLHFELRSSQKITSHMNPVPYFSIDWNSIVTAKAKQYPGRLSGENPHPKF